MKKIKYLLLFLPLFLPSFVSAATTDIGYITNDTSLIISNNKGADYTLNHGVINNTGLTDINSIIINITNQNFLANTIYQVEIQTPNAKFNTNINSFRISGYNTTCRYYGMAELNTAYPKIYFSCPANTSYIVIGLNTIKENINITTGSNFSWNYTYLRKLDDSSDMDFGPVISNQTQNTNDIIDNDNDNTQQIIDSQNSLLGSECLNLFDSSTITTGDISNNFTNIRLSSRQSIYLQPGTYYFKTNISNTYNYNLLVSSSSPPVSNPTFIYNSGWLSTSSSSFTISSGGYFVIYVRRSDNGNISLSDISNVNFMLSSTNLPYCKYGSYTSKLDDTNNAINNLDDTINDDDIDNNNIASAFEDFNDYLDDNSTITQLITLPITLYTAILNNVNGSCSPFNLGSLYGEDLILPCINISQYLGNSLWTMIDIIISGFAIYAISKKMIKIFNNFSSLKEGDVIDD